MTNKISSHNSTPRIYYLLFKEKLLKFANLFFNKERFVLSENEQNAISFYKNRKVTQLSSEDSPTSRAAQTIFNPLSSRNSLISEQPPITEEPSAEEELEVGHLWDRELNPKNSEKIREAFAEINETIQKDVAEGIKSCEQIRKKIIKQYGIEDEDNFFDNALFFAASNLAKQLSEVIKGPFLNKKAPIVRELLVTAEKEWILKRERSHIEDLYKKTLALLKDKDRLVTIAQRMESNYNFSEEKKVKFQFLTAQACNRMESLINYKKDLDLLNDFKVEDSIHKRKIHFQNKLLKIVEGKDSSPSLKELSEEIKGIKNRKANEKRWKQWLYSELVTSLDEEARKKWINLSLNEGDEEMKEQLMAAIGKENET